MARILKFVVCVAVGMAGAGRPNILAWAAGVDYIAFPCADLIGGFCVPAWY